jgi:CRISPR-associated protein Cmr5
MQTHPQQHANLAWDKVAAIKQTAMAADYKRQANRFPALVLQSGLAQALGFVLAKGSDGQKRFLGDLCAVLSTVHGGATDPIQRAHDIVGADVNAYQRHTRQCLAVAVWFKRLADIELQEPPTQAQPDNANDRANQQEAP